MDSKSEMIAKYDSKVQSELEHWWGCTSYVQISTNENQT